MAVIQAAGPAKKIFAAAAAKLLEPLLARNCGQPGRFARRLGARGDSHRLIVLPTRFDRRVAPQRPIIEAKPHSQSRLFRGPKSFPLSPPALAEAKPLRLRGGRWGRARERSEW
jgi:hypothetical protein